MRSLMPHSLTILRASSVMRTKSFCAPVETCPNTISSAMRPPSATTIESAMYSFL